MQRARRSRRGKGGAQPACWLFTDERLGGACPDDPLWRCVAHLPRGAGIVFRHYGWPMPARQRLLDALARIARRRGLFLVGSRILGAPDGNHWPATGKRIYGRGLTTAAAHGRREVTQAFRAGADMVFLSPVFASASHPGKAPLGPLRFGLAARGASGPVLALGGMTRARFRQMQALGACGFGAIDFWASPSAR